MKNIKTVITKAFVGMLLILSGIYTTTMQYANAISVVSVSYPATSTVLDVSYAGGIFSNNNDTTAYTIGAFGGVAYVWKKSGSGLSENTIVVNATLTGAGSARAIEINPDTNLVYAVTNDKFWRLTSAPVVNLQRAEGIANSVMHLRYDNFNNVMYFCTNDVFGTVNLVTLAPTTLFNNVGAGGLVDCQVDGEDGFMYLSGTSTGVTGTSELAKVSLSTFTIADELSLPTADFLYGNCLDMESGFVWSMESSNARIHKIDMATLSIQATITVGTTPRYCSISDSEQARRLYVMNEGTDNVSILDIDANVVLATPSTCNQGVTAPRPDTKRLFNTTDTYVPCPEATNSVIIDDTVSEQLPEEEPSGSTNGRCNVGTVLDCIGDRSVSTAITGGQDITVVSGNLFCGLGLNATCSGNANENGTGLLLMLITGTFFASAVISTIAIANTKFGAGISYTEIPKEFWLFLVIGVVSFAWYMVWIPDLVFYGMTVGIAGLFAFGLYKHIRGG